MSIIIWDKPSAAMKLEQRNHSRIYVNGLDLLQTRKSLFST